MHQSYVNGQIDGFLDVMNPFEGLTLFGYELSIPNLGPVGGHEFACTVGYVQGAVSGVVVQIGIGILSGGASAPACASSIAKLGLAAARVYSFIVRKHQQPRWSTSLDETHRFLVDQLKADGFFTDYPDLGRDAIRAGK